MLTTAIRKLPVAIVAGVLFAAIPAASAAAAPTVTTETATEVSGTKATLNAMIDTHGVATTYNFEYGTTTAYGTYPEPQYIPAGETKPVHVSARIEGLTANTTYHFRAGAVAGGIGLGKDLTFNTLEGLYMSGATVASTYYWKPLWVELMPGSVFNVLTSKNNAQVNCNRASMTAGTLSAPTSVLSVGIGGFAGFMECEFMEAPATVTMNGCKYVYQVTNAGPPATGSVEITCPTGKMIEIKSTGVCTVKIPAQAPSGATYFDETNAEEEASGAISIQTAANGVTFEKAGGTLCFLIEGTSGATFGGSMMVF